MTCVSSKSGSYSYQYTCSGTAGGAGGAPGAGALVATPTMAPTKAGVPTALPTAEVVVVYVVILVLYGITPADFTKQDADGKLTLALQQQIASVTGETNAINTRWKLSTQIYCI